MKGEPIGWGCLGSVKMRNNEGFSPPPVPGQLLFSGRRGQRFRGKDLSGGGTPAVSRARREIEMVSREHREARRTRTGVWMKAAREGSRDKKKTDGGFLPTKRRGKINQKFLPFFFFFSVMEGNGRKRGGIRREYPSTLSPTVISWSARSPFNRHSLLLPYLREKGRT